MKGKSREGVEDKIIPREFRSFSYKTLRCSLEKAKQLKCEVDWCFKEQKEESNIAEKVKNWVAAESKADVFKLKWRQ